MKHVCTKAHSNSNIHIHTKIPTHSHAQFILLCFISETVAMWILYICVTGPAITVHIYTNYICLNNGVFIGNC